MILLWWLYLIHETRCHFTIESCVSHFSQFECQKILQQWWGFVEFPRFQVVANSIIKLQSISKSNLCLQRIHNSQNLDSHIDCSVCICAYICLYLCVCLYVFRFLYVCVCRLCPFRIGSLWIHFFPDTMSMHIDTINRFNHLFTAID